MKKPKAKKANKAAAKKKPPRRAPKKQPARKPAAKKKPQLKPLAPALSKLVRESGKVAVLSPREQEERENLKVFGFSHHSPDANLIDPKLIKRRNRHRTDFGDLKALARSIDERGGLIQPIALKPDNELIDGERRIRAWALSRFAGQLIPYHVIDIDLLVAGEWDANAQRKAFTPSEAVAIKRSVEDAMRKLAAQQAAARPAETRPAPGRKAAKGAAVGRVADRVATFTGKSRVTISKAEAVVDAAEKDPKRFGKLKEDMDRSGRVDGPFKRLEIMQRTDAIRAAPPKLPDGLMKTVLIDFPWPFEGEADQEEIDAAGRSLRPYPAMSIKAGCRFMKEEVAPRLAPDCAVWFLTTNHHLIRGYAHHLIAALGFSGREAALLTWDKVEIGRGRILREVTEQCVLLIRGKPVINNLGADPPTTLLTAPRRENSRKPDELYRLIERVTPAERYVSIFSTGGEGALWDGYGDQVQKHEVGRSTEGTAEAARMAGDHAVTIAAPENDALQLAALEAIRDDAGARLSPVKESLLEGFVEGKRKRTLNPAGRRRLGELQLAAQLGWLEEVAAGRGPALPEHVRKVLIAARFVVGRNAKRLSQLGDFRVKKLREDKAKSDAIAALPSDVGELVKLYGDTLRQRHDAIVAGDKAAIGPASALLDRLQVKANGGTNFGMAADDSPAERLRVENRAAIGDVPMWGQRGVFRIVVDEMPVIVDTHDDGDFGFHAEDGTRPFISNTGYTSDSVWGFPLGKTVAQHAEEEVRVQISTVSNASGSKRVPRGPKQPLEMPETWYRMPVSWAEVDFGPPEAGGKAFEREQKRLAKAAAKKQKSSPPAEPQGGDRGPRDHVPENYVPPRPDPALIEAARAAGHVPVSMTLDHVDAGKSYSVATCQCGWSNRVRRSLASAAEQDAAIEAHWREMTQWAQFSAGKPADPAGGEMPDLPASLDRRAPAGEAA